MMKSVFVKGSLRSHKYMMEEPSQMFAELYYVKNFHRCIGLIQTIDVSGNIRALSISPEPRRHKAGIKQNNICGDRTYGIVDNGMGPLNQSITTLFSLFFGFVPFIT
jgi:hypothetical protein